LKREEELKKYLKEKAIGDTFAKELKRKNLMQTG
jgi:hypothetical protein